jgi:ribosomal protein S18 acetylase RimI-like enzyme
MRLQQLHGSQTFSVRWLTLDELFSESFRQFAISANGWDRACELTKGQAPYAIAPVAVSKGGRYLGFLAGHLADRIEIDTVGVPIDLRRNGIGSAMLQFVERNLPDNLEVREMRYVVPERSLDVQLCLKANGWRAGAIWAEHFHDGDGFVFTKAV